MKRLWILITVLVLAVSGTVGVCAERLGETELPAELYEETEITCMMPVFPDGVTEIAAKAVPFYINKPESGRDFTLYFMNGAEDLPFINVEDLPELLDAVYNDEIDLGNRYTADIISSSLLIRRENGAFVIMDFTDQTIFFSDRNAFTSPGGMTESMDITMHEHVSESDAGSFLDMNVAYIRQGEGTAFPLKGYNIPMILQDYTGYLPLQTVSDLFLSDVYIMLLYNGESLIAASNGSVTEPLPADIDAGSSLPEAFAEGPLNEVYYTGKAAMKSEALTRLTYNELCMVLDFFYGLKEEHKINSFDRLFISTGLINRLYSSDPAETYLGLIELTSALFRDKHSAAAAPSYMMAGRSVEQEAMQYKLLSGISVLNNMIRMATACAVYYPDGIPGYEEIGDTAYITFNAFTRDNERVYRGIEYTNTSEDVLELLLYANQQIHRDGSPIRNVVLDLSQNTGGQVDTAVMVLSFFLKAAELTLEDTVSGTESSIYYSFDGNADGVFFTDEDGLGNGQYNIYCLISPISFSCGNLVPAVLKSSECVTVIGQRSGGGACAVLPLSTADGNLFAISGHLKISTVKNGTFYSVDEGVDPDFVISKPDHFYDREYLTEWIRQLP